MKRFILPVLWLFTALSAAAQSKMIHLKKADIPAELKYKGGFKDAVWRIRRP